MQLSQAKKKLIRSLSQKKIRDAQGIFVAEGEKVIADIMRGGFFPEYIVLSQGIGHGLDLTKIDSFECHQKDMEAISTLSAPPGVLAVFRQFAFDRSVLRKAKPRWLVTDGIKDPGNMGTLIRTAHWFGADAIVAINSCAELYNPKTVQSSMGSLGRIPVFYEDSFRFFEEHGKAVTFYGADLEGEPLSSFGPRESFALVIGSESHGLSEVSARNLSQKIYIPEFDSQNRPESLNAAVSAGIILSRIGG